MIKKLLFEGAGWAHTLADSDVGNCRLRSAFHDDNGKAIFLEIYGHTLSSFPDKSLAKYGNVVGCVQEAYYIHVDHSINDLWIDDSAKIIKNDDNKHYTWTKAGIIGLLKELNTTVEEFEVDNTHTYRVFTEDEDIYKYGDV